MANDIFYYLNYRTNVETDIYVNQYKLGTYSEGAGSEIINAVLKKGENVVKAVADDEADIKISIDKKSRGEVVNTESGNVVSKLVSSEEELTFKQDDFDSLPSPESLEELSENQASEFAKRSLQIITSEPDKKTEEIKKALDFRAQRFAKLNDLNKDKCMEEIYESLVEPNWKTPDEITVKDVYLNKVWRTQEIKTSTGEDSADTFMNLEIVKKDDEIKLF